MIASNRLQITFNESSQPPEKKTEGVMELFFKQNIFRPGLPVWEDPWSGTLDPWYALEIWENKNQFTFDDNIFQNWNIFNT